MIPDEANLEEAEVNQRGPDEEADADPAINAENPTYKQTDPLSGHVRETIPDEALTAAMMWYGTCLARCAPVTTMWAMWGSHKPNRPHHEITRPGEPVLSYHISLDLLIPGITL